MFGIASNQHIERDSLRTILYSVGFREGIEGSVSYKSHMLVCGKDVFENSCIAVVSDSDIYNSEELSELADNEHQRAAHLISNLYLKFGLHTFEKLTGPFSICIIDKKNQKLIVVTDRYGIKPVVYYWDENNFIFGSRIKEILSAPQSRVNEVDYEAVVDYINFEAIPTPKTIYKSIRKLSPGHLLIFDDEKKVLKMRKYYDIEYIEKRSDEDYFLKNIPLHIEDSVKAVLEYEIDNLRKIGTFLSGGTDSSTVTGMIKKLHGQVKTFSIGFDEPGYNELEYARITAKHFGAEHHEYMVTPHDVLKVLDIMLDVYDEPFGNASTVPTYFCALLAKGNGIDTLIGGDGGDEIFGGNERYATNNIFRIYHQAPLILRRWFIEPVITRTPSFIPLLHKGKKYIRRANIPQPDRFFSYNPVIAMGKEEVFSVDLLRHINGYDPVTWARELYSNVKADDELNKLLYIDMKFTITDNDIRKVTAMSEKAGIRVAYPMLDYRLVNFAATIPPYLKVKGKELRYIFKKSLKDFLPIEVIKKKKHGFGLPVGVWIRTQDTIYSFVKETLLNPNCTIRPLFRDGFIERLFALHGETRSAYYGDILWLLLILERWSKQWRII